MNTVEQALAELATAVPAEDVYSIRVTYREEGAEAAAILAEDMANQTVMRMRMNAFLHVALVLEEEFEQLLAEETE